jgi:hypothetical protein
MPTAKKKKDDATVTAWTPDMKIGFSGSIGACSLQLFSLIPTTKQRDVILRLIKAKHEELVAEGR